MPKFTITISDEITFARQATITVEAADEKTAYEIADNMAASCIYPASVITGGIAGELVIFEEMQIDNQPWDIIVDTAEGADV